MDNLFSDLGLRGDLVEALIKQKITEPTEIQNKLIPLLLENKDAIAESETGSGKTLAYLLPMYHKIDASKREMQSIILAPTHELAMQIFREIEHLSADSGIPVRALSIIGDVNVTRQVEKLKEKPHIIVGSSGRILELIKLKKISAHTIKTIVLDEADRLLDEYNIDDIKAIIKTTLKERQVIAVSATLSPSAVSAALELMKTPEVIKVEETTKVPSNITHMCFIAEQRDKLETLRKLVRMLNPERAMVFINRSDEILVTSEKLKYHNLKAAAIHGTTIKEDRKKAMDDFISGKVQLLVASDIAARGLDIKGVTHIFNLDMPEDPKNYLHRAGRTGRAGNRGYAISIVNDNEMYLIKKYEKTFGITIDEKEMYMGNIVEPNKQIRRPVKAKATTDENPRDKSISRTYSNRDSSARAATMPKASKPNKPRTTIKEQIVNSRKVK